MLASMSWVRRDAAFAAMALVSDGSDLRATTAMIDRTMASVVHVASAPVMRLTVSIEPAQAAAMTLRMGDIRPHAIQRTRVELGHRTVDVIRIENHQAGRQFVVGDFGEKQSLHSDRPVDLAVIAKHHAAQR